MTCVFMRRDGLSILKAWSYIFYPKCAFRSHVTWNSAVPDPTVWCCILLFLCSVLLMTVTRYARLSIHKQCITVRMVWRPKLKWVE